MLSTCCLLRSCYGSPWPLPAGWADACGKERKGDTKGLNVQYCYQPRVLLCPPALLVPILSDSLVNCKVKASVGPFKIVFITLSPAPSLSSVPFLMFWSDVYLKSMFLFSLRLLSPSPLFIALLQSSGSSFSPQVVLHWDQQDLCGQLIPAVLPHTYYRLTPSIWIIVQGSVKLIPPLFANHLLQTPSVSSN